MESSCVGGYPDDIVACFQIKPGTCWANFTFSRWIILPTKRHIETLSDKCLSSIKTLTHCILMMACILNIELAITDIFSATLNVLSWVTLNLDFLSFIILKPSVFQNVLFYIKIQWTGTSCQFSADKVALSVMDGFNSTVVQIIFQTRSTFPHSVKISYLPLVIHCFKCQCDADYEDKPILRLEVRITQHGPSSIYKHYPDTHRHLSWPLENTYQIHVLS